MGRNGIAFLESSCWAPSRVREEAPRPLAWPGQDVRAHLAFGERQTALGRALFPLRVSPACGEGYITEKHIKLPI